MERQKISERDIQAFLRNLASIKSTEEEWLTYDDAINYLGVSKRTMLRYRVSGSLPYAKNGKKIYFKKSDLAGLLNNHYISVLK